MTDLELIIGKPYIKESNKKVQLCSNIQLRQEKKTLYYEFEAWCKPYLVTDRCDTFLLGLINCALYEGLNIICESAISSELLFQLENYYIPVLADNFSDMNVITISATPINENLITEDAAGTGNSGGIDSFFTILKYNRCKTENKNIKYVIFNNISTQDTNENRIRKQFENDMKEKNVVATNLGLIPINTYSNLYAFYKHPGIFNYYFTTQYASVPMALGKLFSVYYYSSGVSVRDFSVDYKKIKDGAYFDLFTLQCISTRSLIFYSAGAEVSRYEKTRFIVDNTVIQQHLQVCSVDQQGNKVNLNKLNCGRCPKCLRTLSTLYSLGQLNNYEHVFEMNYFMKHMEKCISWELGYDSKEFTVEIYEDLKKYGLLTYKIYIMTIFFRFKHYLRKKEKLYKLYRALIYKD